MAEINQINIDFVNIYNQATRLVSAVFMVANFIEDNDGLRTKIKGLSLELVSMSVKLKDINFQEAKKLLGEIEKNSLELMSILDVSAISGLISKMNGRILKEEFQAFIVTLDKFAEKFEVDKNISVSAVFGESLDFKPDIRMIQNQPKQLYQAPRPIQSAEKNASKNITNNGNGHKRKYLRKNTILEFLRGHGGSSIKDIVPNIIGCSEKTIQRELIGLINEGKIRKTGERRWSRYSIV